MKNRILATGLVVVAGIALTVTFFSTTARTQGTPPAAPVANPAIKPMTGDEFDKMFDAAKAKTGAAGARTIGWARST